MSFAPPGYSSNEPDPAPATPQPAAKAQYVYRSVRALRGREGRTKAALRSRGWEFVSEERGKLRTELTFRRVAPKTLEDYVVGVVAVLRRLRPHAKPILTSACALILIAGLAAVFVGAQGGSTADPTAPQTTAAIVPAAEVAATETPSPAPTPARSDVLVSAASSVADDDYDAALAAVAALPAGDQDRVGRSISRRIATRARAAMRAGNRSTARRLLTQAGQYPLTSSVVTAFDELEEPSARPTRHQQAADSATPAPKQGTGCNYKPCVDRAPSADLDCKDTGPVMVIGEDIYGLDGDNDGLACGED